MISRLFIMIVSSLAIYFSSITVPSYNWDVIGYVASAYSEDGYRDTELQKKTFEDISNEVTENYFKAITEGDFSSTVYADPNSLNRYSIYIQCESFILNL